MAKVLFITVFLVLIFFVIGYAQTASEPTGGTGEVMMIEEIHIQVAPELPTVVVAIPRQKPMIQPVSLQSPLKRMIYTSAKSIKPKLSDVKISKVEKPEKMLAKER